MQYFAHKIKNKTVVARVCGKERAVGKRTKRSRKEGASNMSSKHKNKTRNGGGKMNAGKCFLVVCRIHFCLFMKDISHT